MNFSFLIIFLCFICRSFCENILAILAVPYYSHHIIHHQILQELASRGHNLTIYTPYIMNYENANVTQHYLEGLVETFHKYTNILDYKLKEMSNNEIYGFWEMRSTYKILKKVFKNLEFQKLFKNRVNHYDLIMTECLLCSPIVLAEIYDCPIVMLNAGESHVHQLQLLGNFAHPSIHPDIYVLPVLHSELSFINRINSFIIYRIFVGIWRFLTISLSDYLLYSTFPNLSYKSQDEIISERLKLFLSFTSTMTASIRPIVPIYHQVGFIHVKKPKEIKDKLLTRFLDESKNGIIILSFGSVTGDLGEDLLMRFYEAFVDLPYNVIWKTNVTKFENLFRFRSNVIQKFGHQTSIDTKPVHDSCNFNSNSQNLICQNSFESLLSSIFVDTQCATSSSQSLSHKLLHLIQEQSSEVIQDLKDEKIHTKRSNQGNHISNVSRSMSSNKIQYQKCDRIYKEIFVPNLFNIVCKNVSKGNQDSERMNTTYQDTKKHDRENSSPQHSKHQKIFRTRNILASNWLPLADILAHPNIKLLISHSGLRTIEEAIDREVPMILIPVSYDQPFNAILQSKHEIATYVDINKFTKDSLTNDIIEMTKSKYKENIQKLKKVVYDKMSTGMEDAVKNIEDLLKHNETYEFLIYDAVNNSEFSKSFYDIYLILFLIVYLSVKIIKILWNIVRTFVNLNFFNRVKKFMMSKTK